MGFRSQSSRAQSARVLSGLNPVDTNWSAFNFYRSQLHSQPNQYCHFLFLTTSASLATVQVTGWTRFCPSAALYAHVRMFDTGGEAY